MKKPISSIIGFGLALAILETALAQLPIFSTATRALSEYGTEPMQSGGVMVPRPELADVISDDLSSSISVKALSGVKPDKTHSMRGAKAIQLYRKVSPAVVLVVSEDGLGSGSLLNLQGDILTNWHIVKEHSQVGVIFKPYQEGAAPTAADLRRARVVRYDEVADLALLRVEAVPKGVQPIALGDLAEIEIGLDVHAIGHPTGEAWTYTKGVVSQLRRNYEWMAEVDKKLHRATVIQTQTPINPGNSGGPLLTDDGHLLGVNSFKSQGEGLNFAVAVDEIKRFLAENINRVAANAPRKEPQVSESACQAKEHSRYRSKANDADIVGYDLDCSGKVNAEIRTPDNKDDAKYAVFDRNKDGIPDIIVFDFERDGRWDLSLHDVRYDGKWNLVGHHPDGNIVASSFESYAQYIAKGGVAVK